jgi:predicted anti-sigma-YlaC factor YlaD
MNCEFIRENLIDIVEQTLPEETRKEIDAHLRSCNSCAALTERFARLWQTWQDAASVEPSPAFLPRLWQRIEKSQEKRLIVPFLLSGWERRLRAAAAVASIALGILLGHYLGSSPVTNGVDSSQRLSGREVQEGTLPSEELFDYYLGGLNDFPSGSVAEFYVDPGESG